MPNSDLEIIMCQSSCPYSIKTDDTSGGFMGLEGDRTNYSCGYNWPKEKYVCSGGLGKEPNCLCVQGFVKLPERSGGPITQGMIEARDSNREFELEDFMAGLPIPI